ncbi:hypothetical protein HPP92_027769 [Vanilla planifolia]|uniref:Uncharacterized protein n=1 Tax=Vanilla planifolia TaxID=51239 RepID=A0A835P7X5_VANPL|nr:hypothetical protein HPP92_027769 [Vanilla planifolia]
MLMGVDSAPRMDAECQRMVCCMPRSQTIVENIARVDFARGEIIVVAGHIDCTNKVCHGSVTCMDDRKWAPHFTFLETQTKKSDMFVSRQVSKPERCNEVDWWDPHLRGEPLTNPDLL